MTRKEAFALGYMQKDALGGRGAALGSFLLDSAGNMSTLVAALALLAPVGAGAAAGAVHSAATSPTDLDAETAQKMIEEQEYSEAVEDLKRRRDLSVMSDRKKERTGDQRTLRI